MANELHKGEDFPVKSRAAASSTVRFLHLSDLHFCNPLSVEHDLMMTNLLHDISRLDHGRDLDFAVVSGDVTWSGKKGEYRMAAQHLGRILSAAKVPIGNTIFVPGNHDVDRGKASSLMRSNFYTEAEIARILANRRDVAFLSKKFQNYKRFLDSYLGGPGSRWPAPASRRLAKSEEARCEACGRPFPRRSRATPPD